MEYIAEEGLVPETEMPSRSRILRESGSLGGPVGKYAAALFFMPQALALVTQI